jgi:pimeloyl-ACP methyl ester carboxylesterase
VISKRVLLSDVTLECKVWGPENGTLVLCLHGFPDTNNTFRFLAPHLADQGYRVVAPAMRGYAPSSLATTQNYHPASLAHDALRLHDEFGGDENAIIIGHDWGASATYLAINAAPHKWRRAVTLAVPPIPIFVRALMSYDQLKASWYMFVLQSSLADIVVPSNDMDFLARLWSQWSPHYDAIGDLAFVRDSLGANENLSAALGYYRTLFSPPPDDPVLDKLLETQSDVGSIPTLYIHGRDDGCFLASGLINTLDHLAPNSRMEIIERAGHFVHLEAPEVVHALIDSFLAT